MKLCKRCNHPVYPETDPEIAIDYPFVCPECDENMFSFEVEEATLPAIKELWAEFGDVPMDPEIECIESPWLHFPTGTFREDIWHWFEEVFGISVAKDLMGL